MHSRSRRRLRPVGCSAALRCPVGNHGSAPAGASESSPAEPVLSLPKETAGSAEGEEQSRQGRLTHFQPSLAGLDVFFCYPAVPAGLFSTAPAGACVGACQDLLFADSLFLRNVFCISESCVFQWLFMRWVLPSSTADYRPPTARAIVYFCICTTESISFLAKPI